MATPKGNRMKNVFSRAPLVAREPSPEIGEVPHLISSVQPHIPSSVTRPTTIRRLPSSEFSVPQNPPCLVRQTPLFTVMQTPTRGSLKSIDVLANPQLDREEDELCQDVPPRLPSSKPFQTPNKASRREPRRSLSSTAAASTLQLQAIPPEPIHTSLSKSSPSKGVAATPLKQSRDSFTDSGIAGSYQKTAQESYMLEGSGSIYESLGWDDDTDDLL